MSFEWLFDLRVFRTCHVEVTIKNSLTHLMLPTSIITRDNQETCN